MSSFNSKHGLGHARLLNPCFADEFLFRTLGDHLFGFFILLFRGLLGLLLRKSFPGQSFPRVLVSIPSGSRGWQGASSKGSVLAGDGSRELSVGSLLGLQGDGLACDVVSGDPLAITGKPPDLLFKDAKKLNV